MPSTKLLAATAVALAVAGCTYERRVAAVPIVVERQTAVVTQPEIVPPPQPLLPQTSGTDEWMTPPPGNWDYYYSRRTTEVR